MNMKYEELLLKMRPQDRFGQVQIDNGGWSGKILGSVTDEAYLDVGIG